MTETQPTPRRTLAPLGEPPSAERIRELLLSELSVGDQLVRENSTNPGHFREYALEIGFTNFIDRLLPGSFRTGLTVVFQKPSTTEQ